MCICGDTDFYYMNLRCVLKNNWSRYVYYMNPDYKSLRHVCSHKFLVSDRMYSHYMKNTCLFHYPDRRSFHYCHKNIRLYGWCDDSIHRHLCWVLSTNWSIRRHFDVHHRTLAADHRYLRNTAIDHQSNNHPGLDHSWNSDNETSLGRHLVHRSNHPSPGVCSSLRVHFPIIPGYEHLIDSLCEIVV